ncbi:MAG: serine/threonine-protein phosphatase [Acidobacteria bacterium]|nr:MAG: serine/threonine-protein phosphatase [Acidobacteriota bacterium]
MITILTAVATHPGMRREGNEDAYCVRADLGLYLVADGMGGHAAGEVASRLATETIEGVIRDTRNADVNSTWPMPFDTSLSINGNRLKTAFHMANRRLTSAMEGDEHLRGMATTVAAMLIAGAKGTIAHVGDSRVYRLRGGELSVLTEDHSWVNEQVRAGRLTDNDARRHPWRNVVTRAITGGDDPAPDVQEVQLAAGDRLLICSDGLSSVVSPDEIQLLLADGAPPEATAAALIDAANEAGGPDNITVVIIDVESAA